MGCGCGFGVHESKACVQRGVFRQKRARNEALVPTSEWKSRRRRLTGTWPWVSPGSGGCGIHRLGVHSDLMNEATADEEIGCKHFCKARTSGSRAFAFCMKNVLESENVWPPASRLGCIRLRLGRLPLAFRRRLGWASGFCLPLAPAASLCQSLPGN